MGVTRNVAWQEEDVSRAKSFTEFKLLAENRFSTVRGHLKLRKLIATKRSAEEDVMSSESRLHCLGTDTLAEYVGENAEQKAKLHRNCWQGCC